MTYEVWLKNAERVLKENNLEVSGAKILLMHFSNKKSDEFYTSLEEILPKGIEKLLKKALNKHIKDNIPISYITKTQSFYGYDFLVNKHVLIPRFETEVLVEKLLDFLRNHYNRPLKILDMGTGSGCIGIVLKKEIQNAVVYATDISKKALRVARDNSKTHNANLVFIKSNLFKRVKETRFDVIVSNPPYLTNQEKLDKSITKEPKRSFFGGLDGLDFYRKIIKMSIKYLKSDGLLAFEHAFDKALEIKKIILDKFPKAQIFLYQDLSGKDRITLAKVG